MLCVCLYDKNKVNKQQDEHEGPHKLHSTTLKFNIASYDYDDDVLTLWLPSYWMSKISITEKKWQSTPYSCINASTKHNKIKIYYQKEAKLKRKWKRERKKVFDVPGCLFSIQRHEQKKNEMEMKCEEFMQSTFIHDVNFLRNVDGIGMLI